MAISWSKDADGILEIRVSGKVSVDDFLALQGGQLSPLASESNHRVLIIGDAFDGWQEGDWEQVGFNEEADRKMAGMAVVLEQKWHDQASLFMATDLRPVAIEFFTPDQLAEARQWLLDR